MDVLTDTMSTTQMQSKTGRVDSYDAMIEAERKMYSILDAQAAVKAEDYAYDDEEDAIRRDASDDLFAGYKAGKASQAAVKAEDYAYDEEDALTAASDDFYAGYRIGKASQAAVKAEDYAYDDEEDAIRRDASDDLFAGYKAGKASQAAVKAEDYAYDEEDALTAASDDFYAGYRIGKASQAAVEAENDEEDAIDKLFRKKINLMRARRDARYEFRKNHHV